jgi:hypothetical protein
MGRSERLMSSEKNRRFSAALVRRVGILGLLADAPPERKLRA